MSKLTEKGTEDYHGIGQHEDMNRGPASGAPNSGQRTIVRSPASITPGRYEETVNKESK